MQVSFMTRSNEHAIRFAQFLAWLAAALQFSRGDAVESAQAELYPSPAKWRNQTLDFTFVVNVSTSRLKSTSVSCWHDLFCDMVVVDGFEASNDEPKATTGRGLEVPLSMMATLGGAYHVTEYGGGLVIKGFSSMFVPISSDADHVQWHYLSDNDGDRLPFDQADIQCPNRAMLADVTWDDIVNKTCYLGWVGRVAHTLGTADANYCNIDFTSAKEPERPIHFHGGSLGFQNIGTGELNFSPGMRDSRLHVYRNGTYKKIIKYAANTPTVLYDPGEKRGWLVPASAVIAHIAQTRSYLSLIHI